MPRRELKIAPRLEDLSVLEQGGQVDDDLEPQLDDDLLRRLHRTMLLSRRFDERLLRWQRQGRIGTFAPAMGQEASQIGAAAALRDSDWMVPSYRESAAALWRGTPLWGLILYDAGYNEGAEVPEGQKDLPICVPVASQIPHAVGLAYAAKYRGTDEVVMVFFGDGATSEGDFHEAVNLAGVYRAPVVFVCQNNQWAISTPLEKQTAAETLAHKAVAYGIPGVRVDGNDVLGVYLAASEAVEQARAGDGPTLLECVTYRLSVHTTADDPSKYREEEDVEDWEEHDPIPRLRRYLLDRGTLSEDDVERLEQEVDDDIEGAWDEAEGRMQQLGDPVDMFDHVYAEMPPYLAEQREAFAQQHEG
ncbi:MAG TPA: pyruvate dehydrogenase (acetyl-transferring) E1 component subunit alpha [Egibacteraceae bacterium]|nr:pyruvate dehydrogenase (acetyl-transferring) E1 component subunit alpha [Egibacteraceae bacterium]